MLYFGGFLLVLSLILGVCGFCCGWDEKYIPLVLAISLMGMICCFNGSDTKYENNTKTYDSSNTYQVTIVIDEKGDTISYTKEKIR